MRIGLGLSSLLLALPPGGGDADVVAIQAGTVHLVEGGRVLSGGATILVRDGKIEAVGKDVALPANARVVDYGPDAVVVPGLVSANSPYGWPVPSDRGADAGIRAVDQLDPYDDYWSALREGITSLYLAPAAGRLIAGQGAVVKAAGEQRVLEAHASIHGSIAADARNTPGYWEPPIPATVDVGMGVAEQQLPRTTMGAMVALDEILALVKEGKTSKIYGPNLAADLRPLLDTKLPWRMRAEREEEIRAVLDFFGSRGLPLVIEGAEEAAPSADLVAHSGFPVIVEVYLAGSSGGGDFGKGEDARWPRYDAASKLAAAGVPIAIVPRLDWPSVDLRLAAASARRGGLSESAALEAITLGAAKILGVSKRVGSIAAGKDADLAILNGPPLDGRSSVLATWIDGEVAWKKNEGSAVVLSVDELHLGDGSVLSPGEVAMVDGKIVEVGQSVSRPAGATVVRGKAAMPGMIDGLGFLGLDGSRKDFSTRMQLTRIVEPGDVTDRRVARAGITTVQLGSRGGVGNGSPTLAYKPAGCELEQQVVADPAALRMQWTERIRSTSGEKVRDALGKADEYRKKWEEYEKALAEWVPPAAGEASSADKQKDEEKKEGESAKEESKDEEKKSEEGKSDEKKEESGSKKKKDEAPFAPTGVWETKTDVNGAGGASMLRLRLLDEGESIEGSLRCAAWTDGLVDLAGKYSEKKLELSAEGTRGKICLALEVKDGKLEGKAQVDGAEHEVVLERTSTDYGIAKRTELRRQKDPGEPKGKPKSPGINPDLEPLRRAMLGTGAVVVTVEREDEIVACVEAFAAYGIRPVLYGAEKAIDVIDQIRGKVAGVLPSNSPLRTGNELGTRERNLYAELQAAGVPVAFHSEAEEGAATLPALATWAVSHGMSREGALRALTSDAAKMFALDGRVGRLASGLDADVLLLDGAPLDPGTSVLRVWVAGKEIR